ncbi:MAG: sodium/solute symporter [Planctomycetes bacterium]|nr:sodium/solute symporter [Planctomycetota bacterium]
MALSTLDLFIFVAFFSGVVGFSMYKSRRGRGSEDYFLAGRGLTWPLIGLSIVAANLSTEQFVGMAGQGAGEMGLAVSAWQLTGAVGIVIVAFTFLPKFLRAGIYTMPEFLEHRFHPSARALMAVWTLVIYAGVLITTVLYSGALTLHAVFDLKITYGVWLIALITALYTTWGGLKAVAWADLFLGSTLLIGGLFTMKLGFDAVGGASEFFTTNADRLHMILPADHESLPWTGIAGGMWIPIFYYCGLNQFIVQRSLAARDLHHGQMGVIFAAFLWLLVPFAIVLPGIMAGQLYGEQIENPDQAYPLLISNLVPSGARGFLFAAVAGAVISSLASMLNSASTIFTMDLYYRHFRPAANQAELIRSGRMATLVCVVIGGILAPQLADPRFGGVFNFIQEFQGYVSPGILAAFAFGLAVPKAPTAAGLAALILSAPIYGFLQWQWGDVAYLHRMLLTFLLVIAVMTIITLLTPLAVPRYLPVKRELEERTHPIAYAAGTVVILLVVAFFIVFQ